jgi:soluble lytic murein transglycosylase-like protein
MKDLMNRSDTGPVGVRRQSRLRNDTKSLLRSRPLQAVLALVAGVQVMAVAAGSPVDGATPRGAHDLASRLSSGAPAALVAAPVRVAQKATKATVLAVREREEDTRKLAAAEEVAGKYRRRGFKVSPALARQIHNAAVANRIDPDIAFGLVRTESGFESSATSPVGAIGLTQLMPATARLFKRGITRSELRNPEVNLRIGFRYLRELLDKYDGDTELALTAYNRGPGTVDRVLKRGGDPDNGYAGMVLGRRNRHR